jgi:hypothetical protein
VTREPRWGWVGGVLLLAGALIAVAYQVTR